MRLELRLRAAVAVTCMFVVTFTPVCSHCPDMWSTFENKCYNMTPLHYNWSQAVFTCHKMDGQLVEINSEAENNHVKHVIHSRHELWAWIGINDIAEEGKWVLASSNIPIVYQNWNLWEPNDRGGEDCGSMYNNGRWNDLACWSLAAAVCERDMPVEKNDDKLETEVKGDDS